MFIRKPLTEEEEALTEKKISEYCDSMAPPEPRTEEEQLVFKISDEKKNVIGGCVVNIHAWGNACDWNIDFFKKNGYTVRGELPDYPRGHTAYEIEKRI